MAKKVGIRYYTSELAAYKRGDKTISELSSEELNAASAQIYLEQYRYGEVRVWN